MTFDRIFAECSILGFQAVVTTVLALTCYTLWLRQRGAHFLTWAAAWAVYVVRLAAISAFIVRRDYVWLFVHQAATLISAWLLLAAALQLVRGLSSREIASALDISTRTVETHRANLMRKLGVKSVALLTQMAIREGLVP